MSAANPARDAQLGKPFAGPKGSTWVRCEPSQYGEWEVHEPTPGHGFRARSARQEEAEAAGLVPLYSFPEFESIGWVRAEVAAPAPLDPFNPDHRAWAYRQAAMALDPELYAGAIDDLQRWADEAEDRVRAEEYARAEAERDDRALGGWSAVRADVREWHIRLALRVIRGERARPEATS